jgi:hypothetical protein
MAKGKLTSRELVRILQTRTMTVRAQRSTGPIIANGNDQFVFRVIDQKGNALRVEVGPLEVVL